MEARTPGSVAFRHPGGLTAPSHHRARGGEGKGAVRLADTQQWVVFKAPQGLLT